MGKMSFRMAVTEVLIDHELALYERRQLLDAGTWADESDVYTVTILRLRELFTKQLQEEGWRLPSMPHELAEPS